ncbi:MAG TPA: hypothetical protein PLA74_07500 [Syntrophales bacterium]|nr:hypothetical protein [Syntrophales bacterium]
MKRVLTFLAIMLLPLSVWAMTPVTDSDLAGITGQAGVNINVDLLMNVEINTLAWGDDNGIDSTSPYNPWGYSSGNGGYIGLSGFNIYNLGITARVNDTYDDYTPASLKPLTIDVASGTGYNPDPLSTDYVTYVRIGLGSLAITLDDLRFTVGLADHTGWDGTFDYDLGHVAIGALGIYIDPASYVDIYALDDCGVNMKISVELDHFEMDYAAWGDDDGFDSDTASTWHPLGEFQWVTGGSGGWVGVDEFAINGPININGTMRIDVGTTLASDVYGGATIVQISFPVENFVIDVQGSIVGDVVLGPYGPNAPVFTGTMGDFFIQGLKLTIAQDSWVHIWAH